MIDTTTNQGHAAPEEKKPEIKTEEKK